MKRQFVITKTIRQSVIPALLGSWVTYKPFQNVKKLLSLNLKKNVIFLNVGPLRISQVFSLSCKIYDKLLFHERYAYLTIFYNVKGHSLILKAESAEEM
jgi:hypothetical protein